MIYKYAQPKWKKELQQILPLDFPCLGEPMEYYSTSTDSPGSYFFAAIGFLFFSFLAFLTAVLFKDENPEQNRMMKIAVALFAIIVLVVSCSAFYLAHRSWGRRFEIGTNWVICKSGLILIQNGKPKAYPWESLSVLFCTHVNMLEDLTTEERLPLPPCRGTQKYDKKMLLSIQRLQADCFVDKHMEKINAGDVAKIGPFEITKETICFEIEHDDSDESVTCKWGKISQFNIVFDANKNCARLEIREEGEYQVDITQLMPDIWMFQTVVNKVCPHLCKMAKAS